MTFTTSRRRTPILALPGLAAVALVFTGITGAALAQDQTVVIGNRGGSPVQVDLSVLEGDSGGASPRQRVLLFPGSTVKPGQRIILRRPGTSGKRTRLRKPRRRPARRSTGRTAAAPSIAPKPSVVMPAAKPRIKPKMTMSSPAKAKPTGKRRGTAKVVVPPRTRPKPKSRATANLKAPPLAPPTVMKKPKPTVAPPRTAIPPIPAPPKAVRKPIPAPRRVTAAPAVPPPPPPLVAAAPRASVTATPLAKTTPAPAKARSPRKQVASIPRLGPVATGSKRRILFAPGSARLEADGQTILGPVSAALAKNPRLRVELKAYARGNTETVSQARRLSLSRALAVRSHLIKRGVKATRIDVRALGAKFADGIPNRVDLLVFTR